MGTRAVTALITLKCRACGWQFADANQVPIEAVDADGHIRACPRCPGKPCREFRTCTIPRESHSSCMNCAQDCHTGIFKGYNRLFNTCMDCLASGKGKRRCDWTYHRGERMVLQSLIRRVYTETAARKDRREWYVCPTCFNKNRTTMHDWDKGMLFSVSKTDGTESSDAKAAEEYRLSMKRDVTLQAKPDPYAAYGGRTAVWKPRAGLAGVGSYVLFRHFSHERVYVGGKYVWIIAGWLPVEFVQQGNRVPIIVYAPLVSVWCQPRHYVFIRVDGVQPNRFKYGIEGNKQESPHTHTIIVCATIDGMLDDCLEAGLDVSKGARYLT